MSLSCRHGVRALHTSTQRARMTPRIYRYWIDVHGQLFMYDTVPKNLTSCKYILASSLCIDAFSLGIQALNPCRF